MNDEDTTITLESIVEENMDRSIYLVTTIVAIDVFILVVGVVGNLITCFVIIFSKPMHTSTNFYLFNLAISDLLMLITSGPHEIFTNITPYKVYLERFGCYFNNWAAETSVYVSIMTITSFTIERYLAICHPFLIHSMSNQISRVVKILIVIWIVALTSAYILTSQSKFVIYFLGGDEKYSSCYFEESITHHAFETNTFIFFVVPMIIITVMYILMGLKLIKARNDFDVENNSSLNNVNKRTLKILAFVVAAFFICWVPFHVQRMLALFLKFGAPDSAVEIAYRIINDISGILYLLSAAINPLIYSIMSSKFRNAFKELLSRFCKNSQRKVRSNQDSSIRITNLSS